MDPILRTILAVVAAVVVGLLLAWLVMMIFGHGTVGILLAVLVFVAVLYVGTRVGR